MAKTIRPRLVLSLAVALLFLTVTSPAEAASSSLQVRQMVYTGATPTAPALLPQAAPATMGNGPIAGALDASSSFAQPSPDQSLPVVLLSMIEDLRQAVRRLAHHEPPSQPAQSDASASRIAPAPPPARVVPANPIPDKAPAPKLPAFIGTRSPRTPAVAPGFPLRDIRTITSAPPRVVSYPFIPPVMQVPIAAPAVASWLGASGPEIFLIDATSIGLTGIALALFLSVVWMLRPRRGGFRDTESVR